MKMTYAKYFLCAACVTLTLASCSREEDDIWDQDAIERLDAARNEYYNLLCSAPNGWEMYYFANNKEAGYNFVMKFEQGDKVTIGARNANTGDVYQEEASIFDVITDDGPVLTFETYNSLFHRYADPDPEHTTIDSDGIGSGGDYEFKIMSASGNEIYMRGKKTGIEIYMYPLESGVTGEQYFNDVYAMHDRMFSSSIPTLRLTLADGVGYTIMNDTVRSMDENDNVVDTVEHRYATDQVLKIVRDGDDIISESTIIGYVVTRNGLRCMNAVPGDTLSTTPVREFTFNAEGTYLVSTGFGGGTQGATIKAPVLSELFPMEGTSWRINPDKLGGQFATIYRKLVENFPSVYGGYRLDYLAFSFDAVNQVNYMDVGMISNKNKNSVGRIYCVSTANGESVMRINFNDPAVKDNTFGGMEAIIGRRLMQRVQDLVDFCNMISTGEYTMIANGNSELLPAEIKFECTSNADDYFYVNLQ